MDNLIVQALNKTKLGILIVDRQLRILVWNGWLERFTGLSSEEVLGKNLLEICPRFKIKMYMDILQNALYHGQSRFCSSALHKTFILPKDGGEETIFRQNLHVEPLYDNDHSYAMLQISDTTNTSTRVYKLKNLIKELETEYTEIKEAEKISKHLSLHDSLTDLPNRLAFKDRLAWSVSNALRNESRFALMFVDTDGFKKVNDTYGHEVGDQVLQEVAERLKGRIRSTDSVARLGGDEFCIILNHLKHDEDAGTIATGLLHVFDIPFIVNSIEISLSISIGISLFPKHAQDPSELLKFADMAMYRIKKNGKRGFMFYDPEMEQLW
ncbi:diguanylate cyclase [Paenibacillus barcinonensis]|uniref:Diguanylate cyclase n=1 Tax=Paenibacillus barcinonensis TaxID=198119 RepID=A0A2V4WA11_PAEBA|nr:diguanylate cyclase [Paenibacillus barcinonensis]PYE48015.1 PAS domain S-box-containing protein/diguanylate cyclase (GGDEF)-like protein [Paenibacillus barcinonensis]QKS55134.1 diguanylate cyclase [Paenibacillus barcinonensis]